MLIRASILVAAVALSGLATGSVHPGSGQDVAGWRGTMEERDGAIWVENSPDPLWPDNGRPRFDFVLEQVFGADEFPEEALLGSALWGTVDDAGNVYVVDGKASELVAFAPDGTVRWRVSSPGQGPRDIQGLKDLAWDGTDRLLLLNQSGTRLDTWRLDGTFVSSYQLQRHSINRAVALRVVDPTTIDLVTQSIGEVLAYRLTDGPDWTLAREVTLSPPWFDAIPPLQRAFSDIALRGDQVVLGSVTNHAFAVLDVDGSSTRRVMRPGTGFLPSVSRGLEAYVNLGSVSAPVWLQGGYWLGTATWVTNVEDPEEAMRRLRADSGFEFEYHHEWELYDEEGRWLASRVWEHSNWSPYGAPRWVGPDGRLYTSSMDPFPQVRRYRVVIRPPE